MSSLVYTRMELLRTLRNRRFFIFSLVFPLVLYYFIALPNRAQDDFQGTGLSAPLYYMVSLGAFGAMMAVVSSGGRIATERLVGWNRQLRITPLPPSAYLRTKVLTAYVLALSSIVLLYLAGLTLGVSLSFGDWLRMTGLMLVGLIPFAALGVLLGHLLSPDTMGPAVGGGVSLLALVSGTWFPVTDGALHTIAQCLPSYWLVQASHVALGGGGWTGTGWLVVALWSAGLALLARWAYRRDTKRL